MWRLAASLAMALIFMRASIVATYVFKILNGARAADLPVELPTKLELAINMKAAKEVGIAFPTAILVRADRVTE
jgi:putative tryptophan/tyrosine transport system substrate-binding protein